MKHGKGWSGVSQVVLFLSILSGCATTPTKEEIAALDYGACPVNHEKMIQERFQSGLLTAYAGEPIIWPPRKFLFKLPLPGSKIQAGYLVPVMAEQTRGSQMLLGKQLYGFFFKNGELQKVIYPNFLPKFNISERVGPFPKDERDWQEGHSDQQGDHMILEYVLPGETVQNWSELISVQILSNVPMHLSAEEFVAGVAEAHRTKNPGCAVVSQDVLASTPTEVLYEQTLANCAPFRDEYSIRKAIRGPRSLTEVSYSKTSELTDIEKRKWAGIVGQATTLNECQQ